MARPTIEIIARALIRRHDGAALLCVNKKHGYAYLPGGHVEFGESARDALARELLEEAGEPVSVGELIAVIEEMFESDGMRHHELNLVFHVERQMGRNRTVRSRERKISFVWCRLSEIARWDIRPVSVKRLLLDRLRQPIDGKFDG